MNLLSTKIQPEHVQRLAYVYVRQSSLAQLQDHQESTRRQYELQQRAWQLGWSRERIVVVDTDLGHSASDPQAPRDGFAQLLAEVALGRVGAILSVEVSRLARIDSEWHRLVELAALTGALLIDEHHAVRMTACCWVSKGCSPAWKCAKWASDCGRISCAKHNVANCTSICPLGWSLCASLGCNWTPTSRFDPR